MEDPLFGKPERNFAPRTIWTGDNLDILRGINSETVDLIYLDPPFNSNRTYSAPIGSKAAGAAFEDKRRRSIGGEALTHSVSVALPVSLWTRLDALSATHGVARGTIAREAIEAGLRAVTERLRRATRRDARDRGADPGGEAGK